MVSIPASLFPKEPFGRTEVTISSITAQFQVGQLPGLQCFCIFDIIKDGDPIVDMSNYINSASHVFLLNDLI